MRPSPFRHEQPPQMRRCTGHGALASAADSDKALIRSTCPGPGRIAPSTASLAKALQDVARLLPWHAIVPLPQT